MVWGCRMFATDCGRCTRIRLGSIPSSTATCSWWPWICLAGRARFGRVPSTAWTHCWRDELDGGNPGVCADWAVLDTNCVPGLDSIKIAAKHYGGPCDAHSVLVWRSYFRVGCVWATGNQPHCVYVHR